MPLTGPTRGTADKLSILDQLGIDHDIKEYPGAGHAFLNDHDNAGDRTAFIFVVIGAFARGAKYHEPSAQDARRRITAFFAYTSRSGTAHRRLPRLPTVQLAATALAAQLIRATPGAWLSGL